jgi:hypothetical protein
MDWLAIAGLFLAAVGLFLNFDQQRKSNRQRRTSYISDLLQKIYDEKDLAKIYYSVEYGEFEYTDQFHGSETEIEVDRLIVNFDILAKKFDLGLVKIEDFDLIAYEYLVLYQNRGLQQYFKFLDGYFDEKGIKAKPFGGFRKLGLILEKKHSHYGKNKIPGKHA